MTDRILISINDIQKFRKVDPKFNTDRFNSFALEVQRKNLCELLGESLYYDFFNNLTDTKYTELLNGKSYAYSGNTIQYYGLIPALCYWWLSAVSREGMQYIANYGAIQFTNNPQQNFEESKTAQRLASEYTQTAQTYANNIILFLNRNSSVYALWSGGAEDNPAKFITFKLQ